MKLPFLCLIFLNTLISFGQGMGNEYIDSKSSSEKNLNAKGYELLDYNNNSKMRKIKKDHKIGLLNTQNYQIVIPVEYDEISFFITEDSVAVATINNKSFLLNTKNKLISPIYDYIDDNFKENMFLAKKDNKYTYINSNGISFKKFYDEANNFVEGYAEIKIDNKWGLIDKKENIIIPVEYGSIRNKIYKEILAVSKNEKWGFVDLKNNIVVPLKYDDVSDPFYDDESIVTINNKKGVIDKNDNIIIDIKYDEIYLRDKKNYRKAVYQNYKGLLDQKGNIIIPFEYKNLYKYSNKDRLPALKNNMWGIIDLNNQIIIPFIYDNISLFDFEKNNIYSKSQYIYKVSNDGGRKYLIINEENKILKN